MIRSTAMVGVVAEWNDGHMWGGGGGAWVFMTVMMLFAVAVTGLVVWVIARGGEHRPRSGSENARAILAERMARGDIDPEQYRERLQHLQ